jgi:hypothetical protein
MKTIIKQILAHANTPKSLLANNYLEQHLTSINCIDNLRAILNKLNNNTFTH